MEELTGDRREPSTKILFKANFSPDNTSPLLKLGATGVRKRWMFNVYAFGLYFDPEDATTELKRWNTYTMEELVSNLSFYNAITASNFQKGLRMVLARTVKGSDLQIAFEESLRPSVERFAKEFSHGHNKSNKSKIQSQGYAAVEEFRSQFSTSKIGKGTEIYIKNENTTLITWINGKEQKRIDNKILCCALFDIYLGNNPISTNAKELYAVNLSLLVVDQNRLNQPQIQLAIRSRL